MNYRLRDSAHSQSVWLLFFVCFSFFFLFSFGSSESHMLVFLNILAGRDQWNRVKFCLWWSSALKKNKKQPCLEAEHSFAFATTFTPRPPARSLDAYFITQRTFLHLHSHWRRSQHEDESPETDTRRLCVDSEAVHAACVCPRACLVGKCLRIVITARWCPRFNTGQEPR